MAISRIRVASAGMAASGARRLRQAGAAPTSAEAQRAARLALGGLLVGRPLDLHLALVEPARGGLHQQRCWSSMVGGSAVRQPVFQADRASPAAAGRSASCPAPGCGPDRARTAAGRRSLILATGGAALGAGLAASDHAVGVGEVRRRGGPSPGRPDIGRDAVGGEARRRSPSQRVADRHRSGEHPGIRIRSTITSSASPQVLPVSACRLDRPTDHAGYWRSIIASVSDSTSKNTSSQATTPAASRPPSTTSRPGKQGSRAAGEVEPGRQTSVTTRDSPSSIVVNPKCHSGTGSTRDTEVGYVPPAVDAGERQRGNEQHQGSEHRAVASGPQRVRGDGDRRQRTQRAGRPANTRSGASTWWGIIARNEMIVMPMMRRWDRPRCRGCGRGAASCATETASATSSASTANRRAIEPSGLAMNSRS